jgi:hypothetical protein
MADRLLDEEAQERLQAAIQTEIDEEEGTVVGWIVVYETVAENGNEYCGHLYGPAGMTSWRSLGLLNWATHHTIKPEPEDDD